MAKPVLKHQRAPQAVAMPQWLVEAKAEAARRLAAVQWETGRWYAIYDEGEGVAGAQLFECEIGHDGGVYLIDDMCDYDRRQGFLPECREASEIIHSHSVIVPQ